MTAIQRPIRQWMPRVGRLVILAAAAALIYAAAAEPAAITPPPPLAAVQGILPAAARLTPTAEFAGGHAIWSREGGELGVALTTSPQTDDLVGYTGPSNLLIVLGPDRRVAGVKLLSSGDTTAHVAEVQRNEAFWQRFLGWSPATERMPAVDAVSGSTLTSLAMAEAVERRLAGTGASRRFPQPVTLAETQTLFPSAADTKADDPRPGWQRVSAASGQSLGFVLRTAPAADNVRGYRGPTESLAAIGPDGRTIIGVKLRHSFDTPDYVERVRDDADFLKLLTGRDIDAWPEIDFAKAGIEGVSGATQTSFAVAEGIRRRLAADVAQREQDAGSRSTFARNVGLLGILLGAGVTAFTRLRSNRRWRLVWQVILVAGFGLWLGDLLSLALLAGWSRAGIAWRTSPMLVALAAGALVVPWATRRNVYCQHVCPHGAVQEWLGRFPRLHVPLPEAWRRWLGRIPAALLVVAFGLAVLAPPFDLATLEPFDAWVLKGAALASAILAVVGLAASLFVPQAYCRFGCPTGALLKFVRSGGRRDALGWREGVAVGLLLLGGVIVLPQKFSIDSPASQEQLTDSTGLPALVDDPAAVTLGGEAFGTTWSVKFRRQPPEVENLRTTIAAEIRRIEATLSHWRPESSTSQFNASATTLEMEQPAELLQLIEQAQDLSRATDGAFDITVGPLVQAWGFGPGEQPLSPPSEAKIAERLARTGWEKLVVDRAAGTLQKTHPELQIDLGALLQGYAADRVAATLAEALPNEEYLIDVGGELLARGRWRVAIENPADPHQPLLTLTLENAALATSGIYRAERTLGGEPMHHFISPLTGRPVAITAQLCAVRAATCLAADGWATALMLMGLPEAIPLADERQLETWLLDPQGQLHASAAAGAALPSR